MLCAHLYHSKPAASVDSFIPQALKWFQYNSYRLWMRTWAACTDNRLVLRSLEPDNLCTYQKLIPDPVGIVLLLLGELVSPEVAVLVPDDVSDDLPESVSTPSALLVEEEEPWLPELKESVPWIPPLLPVLASKSTSAAASTLFVLIRPSQAFQ